MKRQIIEDNISEKYGTKSIKENKLEIFENRHKDQPYIVSFTCPEFTSLCPRSGFPDFATIYIDYAPGNQCVELKSLKLYLNGFREKEIFHEDVNNIIQKDLVNLLDPTGIRIISDFTVRGNIHTVVASYQVKEKFGFPPIVVAGRTY